MNDLYRNRILQNFNIKGMLNAFRGLIQYCSFEFAKINAKIKFLKFLTLWFS